MNKVAACLVAAVLLSGCTRYVWVKPIGDPNSFAQDNYACKQNAMNTAPPVYEVYDNYPYHHHPSRIISDCHGDHCRTRVVSQPYYAPPPTAMDLNSYNRNELYNACMQAQGWVLQPVEQ